MAEEKDATVREGMQAEMDRFKKEFEVNAKAAAEHDKLRAMLAEEKLKTTYKHEAMRKELEAMRKELEALKKKCAVEKTKGAAEREASQARATAEREMFKKELEASKKEGAMESPTETGDVVPIESPN